jgi:hypothetical protein
MVKGKIFAPSRSFFMRSGNFQGEQPAGENTFLNGQEAASRENKSATNMN